MKQYFKKEIFQNTKNVVIMILQQKTRLQLLAQDFAVLKQSFYNLVFRMYKDQFLLTVSQTQTEI